MYRHPARYKVPVAGRRWGKTQLSRARLIGAGMKARDTLFWYLAPTRIMAKDIMWADLKGSVHPRWLLKPPMETDLSVDLITGCRLQLMGGEDPDTLRGRKLGGVVCDEFADMSPAIWFEALRPSLTDLQGWAWFPGTPKSFNHFYDLYVLGQQQSGEWASWQFRTVDNPFIDADEVEKARHELDPRTFRQEYEASFETVSGRAYYAFRRQVHVAPVTLERSAPVAVSFDFNINPATAIIAQRVRDDVRVWREVFIRDAGGEATKAAASAVKALLAQADWRGRIRIYGDPAGRAQKTTGPSDHAVLREHFPDATWCIRNAAPHVRDRVAAVNSRCETMAGTHHLQVDPSCVRLTADLEQVTFKDNGELNKTGNPLLTHASDAFGYFVEVEFPARQRGASVGEAWSEHWL